MADNAITTDPDHEMQVIDSLVANEFAVEIDGAPVGGIFRVAGLVSFKLDVKTTTSIKKVQEPFKIVKMVQRDGANAFNTWIRETFEAAADIERPTRDLTVVAIDDGAETRRWNVVKAWISEVRYSDFNTASGEMIEETVTIQFEDIEDSWPATD